MISLRNIASRHLNKISPDLHLQQIFSSSSIALFYKLGGTAAAYLFCVLFTNFFGSQGYGVYSLALTVLNICGILGLLGLHLALLRIIPQAATTKKEHQLRSIYKSVLALALPVSVGLAVLVFILATSISKHIFHDLDLIPALRIISLFIPLFVVNQLNIELIRAFKDIRSSEYLRQFNLQILNILFLLILAMLLNSFYAGILSYCLALSVTFGISCVVAAKRLPPSAADTKRMFSTNEIFKIASPMMLTSFMYLVMGHIDIVMLGIYSPTGQVGIYRIAVQVSMLISFFLVAINTIAAPMFSEFYWSRQMENFKKIVRFSSKLMFWSSGSIFLLLVLFCDPILAIFGSEFKSGATALIILSGGQLINGLCGSVGPILNMTGKQKVFRNIFIVAVMTNVVLNILLIPRYGMVGAAMATAAGNAVWNLISVGYIQATMHIRTPYIPVLLKT